MAVVDPAAFVWDSPDGPAAHVRRVVSESTAADGRSPLNEAALLTLRHDGIHGSTLSLVEDGFAWTHDGDLDLVVAPRRRGQGVGRSLTEDLPDSASGGPNAAWSHGDHPAAARLADRFGWRRTRELWLMRRSLSDPLPPVVPAPEVGVRTFKPGADEDAVLAVNAEAFAQHPEQASMSRADLEQREEEPWFEMAGFFVAVSTEPGRTGSDGADDVLGFHWTKVHDDDPPRGEVYVLGVSPRAQGRGVGRLLALTGLHHLRERGLDEVILYVEADNPAAVRLYQGIGFTHAPKDTDVQYTR